MMWIRIRPVCTYWTAGAGPDQNFNFDAVITDTVSNIDVDPDPVCLYILQGREQIRTLTLMQLLQIPSPTLMRIRIGTHSAVAWSLRNANNKTVCSVTGYTAYKP
jgi:hypothetical protein